MKPTFQLQLGKNRARRKTPSKGPLVAEVMSWELSITPDMKATKVAIPMVIIPKRTFSNLIPTSCCLSDNLAQHGIFETKSSHATVDIELKFETDKLKKKSHIMNNMHSDIF